MVSEIKHFSDVDETFTANSVAIIILVLGCLIFLVSFLGCCGAIRENSCGLTTVDWLNFRTLMILLTQIPYLYLVLDRYAGFVLMPNRSDHLCDIQHKSNCPRNTTTCTLVRFLLKQNIIKITVEQNRAKLAYFTQLSKE